MTYDTSLQSTLTALVDPTRRAILESLVARPLSVAELATTQPVSRPAVSQHLKVLQGAGLVQVREAGTRRFYAARRDGLNELRNYLDGFWDDVLEAYAKKIENTSGENHD